MAKKVPKRLDTALIQHTTEAQFATSSSPQTYQEAYRILGRVQQTRRRLGEHYKTIKDAINGSRRVILDLEKSHLARIEPAEVTLQQRILEYENSPAPCTAGGALELVSRPEGAYTIKTARVVVTDTDALIDAVLAGEVPREVQGPHLPTLNKLLRQQCGLFRAAGTRVEEDETVVVR